MRSRTNGKKMHFIELQDQKASLLKSKYKRRNLGNVMKKKSRKKLKKQIRGLAIEPIALIECRLKSNAKPSIMTRRIINSRGFRKKISMFISLKAGSRKQSD